MALGSSGKPVRMAFLLVPRFSMMAFAACLEPLRAANRLSGSALFEWQLVSAEGNPVEASNGISVATQGSLAELDKADMIIVCAGLEAPEVERSTRLHHQLRRLARHGTVVGAISSGSFLLAEAGLLAGRRCTVHWEYLEAFRTRYPQLEVTEDLYVIDRNVFTCSGGTAALDMMVHFISQAGGSQLALAVAEQFIHQQVRTREERQRLDLHARYRIENPKLIQVIASMEGALDEPMELRQMAQRANISVRQVERLFRDHIGSSPKAFYLDLRLAKARTLLRRTVGSLRTIALECGFGSPSHFCHAYKRRYGIPPTHERRSFAAADGAGQPAPERRPIGLQARKTAQL
ncbi:MAG TPA: GlxA family transcriptional regulator [Steroidobacteraceae bacterium]|nr:GlxA family transcriptional regulator [Steroidobacteraceae bacterium]